MDPKLVFVFALLPFLASAEYRVMNTSLGEVTGLVTHIGYGQALHFLGIRYGKAPIGPLRFKPTQLAGGFRNGHLNATVKGASCSQTVSAPIGQKAGVDPSSSEDCLFLNIYRPANKSAVNLAVMVYIHGGAYTSGAGATYDSRYLAVRGNVLVVTINYRLGLFGFVPNSRTESTLGIQDQILALKWVQSYIREFGGDPHQVTIFGQSAGAQSVSFLTMSPKAKGLFKRAISQSGVASSPFGSRQESLEKLTSRVRGIGCFSDIVDCLRNLKQDTLVQWGVEVSPMPVPDGEVIPFEFEDSVSTVHENVDIIMGLNLGDGGLGVVYSCTNTFTRKCDVARGLSTVEFDAATATLKVGDKDGYEAIYDNYNDWYRAPYTAEISLLAADEFTTDYLYRFPVNQTASMIATRGKNKVYVYQFNSTFAAGNLYWRGEYTSNAIHGDDVAFVFGFLMPTASNFRASSTMIRLWTDFAKGKDFNSYEWPHFTPQHPEYLLIDDEHQNGGVRSPLMPSYKNFFWGFYADFGKFPYKHTVAKAPISRGLSLAHIVVVFALFYSLAFE